MTGMEVCLGDIVTIGRGSSPRPIKDEKYFKDGSIPWVKIADATASGKYIIQTKQFVNEYGASFSRHLKKGSLIISASGTLGTPYFLGIDACIHDGWLYFSDYAGVEPEWLYYKLMTLKEYFNGISYGAAIQNINTDIVRETKIFLPDLEIQTKQVQILKSIDELSKTYEDRIRIYESVLAELYNSWFINFKFPNYEQVEFVDGIPEGWELKSVSELTQLISRGITPKYNDETGKSFVINQKCIRDNKLNLELARRQDKEIPDSKLVQKGDVLINSTGAGTLGRVTQVHEALPDTTVDTHVTIVRPLQEISSAWFGAAISNIESYIETLGEGATNQLELKREVIGRIDLVCPAIDIQNQFQKIVEPMQQQILNLMKQNTHLRKLKETLLPRLMSGELDVSKLSSIE